MPAFHEAQSGRSLSTVTSLLHLPSKPTEQALPVPSPPPSHEGGHVISLPPHKGHSRAQLSPELNAGLTLSVASPPSGGGGGAGRESVLLRAILYCLLFPSHPPPPTSAVIISYFSDSTDRPSPRPWTGNFTACYNFTFVIRNVGQASKAPFSPFPLFRFYNHPLLCNLHYLNLELPNFYLRQQDTPAIYSQTPVERGLGETRLAWSCCFRLQAPEQPLRPSLVTWPLFKEVDTNLQVNPTGDCLGLDLETSRSHFHPHLSLWLPLWDC